LCPPPSNAATAGSIVAFLEGKIAKWWIPDDIVFVDALSYGATARCRKWNCAAALPGTIRRE
jgi:fatty-acyl-CoA synthase